MSHNPDNPDNPESDNEDSQKGLTPEQRLNAPNTRVLDACIATINDMQTLYACVAYENQHQ